jgi:4-hydroxybenzoate polyprenyltransferase
MQVFKGFLKLIRWPNLIFIIITQVLFYYVVMQPFYSALQGEASLTPLLFFILLVASVCIAAAGYIINDYFDVNIDLINKPDKLVVEKIIRRRWTLAWHFILSFVGVVLSFYVSYQLHQFLWWLGFCNLGVVILLVVYSTSFKKQLLIGNVLISALTAWVIVVIVLTQLGNHSVGDYKTAFLKLFRVGMLYASFAFIITLMREVVKDMEDVVGDERNGCKTMPIVWGFRVSKVFIALCTAVLVCLLVILQLYILQYYWYGAILYSLVLIIAPLVFSLKVLQAAIGQLHYHTLSNIYKFIMLTGILSMIFFKIYQ